MKTKHGTMADFDVYLERKIGTKKRVCRWERDNRGYYKPACITLKVALQDWYIHCPSCGLKIKEV